MLFKKWELEILPRPTMDRAIEAIEKEDLQAAKALCKQMKHEWIFLHDMFVENATATTAFLTDKLGEESLYDLNRYVMEKTWRQAVENIVKTDPKKIVLNTINTWRAHSCSGVGQHPAKFTVEEDEEKFTFTMDPCGSGGKMWRKGFFAPPKNYELTQKAYPWSFNLKGLPHYCVHCSLMNERMPIEWVGYPINPMEPPKKAEDPCIMYFYKDPNNIPDKYWERYGMKKTDFVPITTSKQ